MVLMCFVLDLRSLSSPLLSDLKQSLLHLSNFYAISSSPSRQHQSEISLRDRIGLCYLFKNRISSLDELKVAYSPQGKFSLRDFHFAVNNLPTDSFLPEVNDFGAPCCRDVKLSSVLSDQVLYSWGGRKDIEKKVVVLSSCLPEIIDSVTKETLMDAADKCVSVEFVLFEQKSNHLSDMQESIHSFQRRISDLDNCSFQTYLPDVRELNGLVKRWLQDLKDDMEELLQARFVFKNNLLGMVKQIFCNLYASVNQIIDGFCPCQTCRCHGITLGDGVKNTITAPSCLAAGHALGALDMIENSVKVGEKTILFMPSIRSSMKLQEVSSPIDFNVVERTNLGTLSEGVIMGVSHVVTPSTCHEIEAASDEIDQPELNAQLFQGLCHALQSSDQGLVCTSNCNMETMKMAAFRCYYILQPSDNGPMLLRRLAGSEEVFPVLKVNQLAHSSVPKEIENSIQASLLKMESKDYNPVLHERGFHQKLNLLVNESLQFGSLCPEVDEATSERRLIQPDFSEVITQADAAPDGIRECKEDKAAICIDEEWEQLVVSEVPKKYSPACLSKRELDESMLSSPDSNKQLDAKTSRILERLEVPKQLKTKLASPTATIVLSPIAITKRPLIPLQPINTADRDGPLSSSQLMKPNFQRLKRKHI